MNVKIRTAGWMAAFLVAALVGCRGTATQVVPASPALAPAAAVGAPDAKLSAISLSPGEIVGTDDMFTPKDGDAAKGGWGHPVDGIPCKTQEYVKRYHVHLYVGIVANGRQVALPDSIGLKHPGPESSGFIATAECFYYIHTHDASGTVHVEVPDSKPPSAALYPFGKFLDIWGVKNDADHFGSFQGHVQVFVGNVPLKQTVVSKYSLYRKDMRTIEMRSHEVIWIVVGHPMVAKQLPQVTFYTEY